MKREDLQKIDGLSKEQIESIMNLHQTDVTAWTTKLTNKDTELKTEKGKVTTLTADLEKYKDVDLEQLQNAKTTYETEKQKLIDDHTKELNDIKFNSALELAVINAKTVDPVALKAHLDISKLKYNEDTKNVEGIDEQLSGIKESHAYLFNVGATGEPQGGISASGVTNLTLTDALTEKLK